MLLSTRASPCLPLRRIIYRCAMSATDISAYKETFARRMAMAGIKPHHRIGTTSVFSSFISFTRINLHLFINLLLFSLEAVGVSGGPDSMALCALSAGWKSDGSVKKNDVSGFVDGLLGIVVDHRLRPESSDEAKLVQDRVHKMCKKSNCVVRCICVVIVGF